VLALDLVTKHWASDTLAYRPPVEVLGQFVRLTYTRNSGVAFGLGAGFRFPYYVFSILAAIVILYLLFRQRVLGGPRQAALALILGGALGNLVDRVSTGEVVDFIEIGWNRWHWPVFNVADSAVTIGVALFALTWSRRNDRHAEAALGRADRDPRPRARLDEPDAGSLRAGAEQRGAAGPISRGGADRPLA